MQTVSTAHVSFFLCSRMSTQDEVLSNHGSVYLPVSHRLSGAPREDSTQLAAVIKMGWLDKNPPQGYD